MAAGLLNPVPSAICFGYVVIVLPSSSAGVSPNSALSTACLIFLGAVPATLADPEDPSALPVTNFPSAFSSALLFVPLSLYGGVLLTSGLLYATMFPLASFLTGTSTFGWLSTSLCTAVAIDCCPLAFTASRSSLGLAFLSYTKPFGVP